jgi:hypothetical protein
MANNSKHAEIKNTNFNSPDDDHLKLNLLLKVILEKAKLTNQQHHLL